MSSPDVRRTSSSSKHVFFGIDSGNTVSQYIIEKEAFPCKYGPERKLGIATKEYR